MPSDCLPVSTHQALSILEERSVQRLGSSISSRSTTPWRTVREEQLNASEQEKWTTVNPVPAHVVIKSHKPSRRQMVAATVA